MNKRLPTFYDPEKKRKIRILERYPALLFVSAKTR